MNKIYSGTSFFIIDLQNKLFKMYIIPLRDALSENTFWNKLFITQFCEIYLYFRKDFQESDDTMQ